MFCSKFLMISHREKCEKFSMCKRPFETQIYLSGPILHLLLSCSMFKVTTLEKFLLFFLCKNNFALGNSSALNSFSFLCAWGIPSYLFRFMPWIWYDYSEVFPDPEHSHNLLSLPFWQLPPFVPIFIVFIIISTWTPISFKS